MRYAFLFAVSLVACRPVAPIVTAEDVVREVGGKVVPCGPRWPSEMFTCGEIEDAKRAAARLPVIGTVHSQDGETYTFTAPSGRIYTVGFDDYSVRILTVP